MVMIASTSDEKLVWDCMKGTTLTCKKNVEMEDEPVTAFTEGKNYKVIRMQPISDPPYIELINDQGQEHKMEAVHIREYFNVK